MPLDLNNNQFLTESQIREKASSVFTATAAPGTSEKYSHISTDRIINDMAELGWGVVDAKQVRARKGEGFQKHLVVFRNNDLFIEGEDGDDVFPQILLTNSHDGKNSFTFTAGLFRLICENGLVISTQEFENMKIRHYGYDFAQLQTVITGIVAALPLTVESMNSFKQTQLAQEQIIELARRAVEVRFGEQAQNIRIDYNELIEPTRPEDRGTDLWSVFNVIQEKITQGMFSYTAGAKVRKARRIKNFKQDLDLNAKLFELAAEFAVAA
jgi:hypothetical protein